MLAAALHAEKLQKGSADLHVVCSAREKINRPQTRRRRENNEDSVDKMQAIRRNLKKAWELLEYVTRREERKRSLVVRRLLLGP